MPKMHQNTFDPGPLAAVGPTCKGDERERREERVDGKGWERNSLPKIK